MLKAEIGSNTTSGVATASDFEYNQILSDVQQWLWTQHQWPFLYTHEDIVLSVNTRYYNYPAIVSLDYPTTVETKWGDYWYPVDYGIKGDQYAISDPDRNQTLDPAERWQIYSATQFEIWPVPATAQTLRFWGTRSLATLKNGSVFDDTKVADLDDLMIVYYAAAEKLQRLKQADAQTKLTKATALFNRLRTADRPNSVFVMSRDDFEQTPTSRRVITIVGNPNH